MHLKKAIEIWASDEILWHDITHLQYNGRHTHVPTECGRAYPAGLWKWEFASRVASGVAAVVCDFHRQARQAYPADYPPAHMRDKGCPSHWPCAACRSGAR
eukprot:6694021-Prorocentrum_lima.AAC.1